MVDNTTLLNELSLVNYVSSLDLDTKGQVLRYYNNIIKARTASDPEHDKFKQDIIDNSYTYSVILNKLFYMAIFSSVTTAQLQSDIYGIENLSGMIRKLRAVMEQKGSKGSVYEELYNHVLKGEDISIIDCVQAADIPKALSCYGVQSVGDDKPFEDIEVADEEDESKFDDFFDNDDPDEEYSEDSVSDEIDNIKKSVLESIKNYVEASEAENIDKIKFNMNSTGISESSDLKINIDSKDNHVCIDINVNITESLFEGDDYEKNINCESYTSSSTIEALKIKGADNEESVSKQIVEYINKILNPVEVTEGTDTFEDIPVANEGSAAEDDTDAKSSDEAEYADAFRQIYEGVDEDSTTPLKVAIDGILKSFYDLYMSCFSGITTPDGVLTNRGLLSIEKVDGVYKHVYNHSDIDLESTPVTDKKYIAYQQNKSKYGQYYKAIMYAIGVTHCRSVALDKAMSKEELTKTVDLAVKDAEAVFGTQIDGRKSLLPKYADATQKSYYPKLHLQLMTGNYNTSKSMKEWVESTKGIHRNGVRVTNFDDIMKYARYLVSTCLTDALIDAGLKIEDAGNNDNEVMSICNLMSSQLKNIIVLTNTKKGYFTVKICSASTINSNALEKAITEYFNMSSSGSKATEIVVKNDGTESGVIEYDVVLNRAEYDKPASFSADVIDDIIETGNVPSWSSAILGEKNNGGALVYNFKKNYSISIYGSSGSGKGIMTSALLSNAIAEGCEVMYIDGKPDNGAALAKVAWDKGLDCAVFNANSGAIVGGTCKTFPDTLENYSHGIRNMDMRDKIINKIPTLDDNDDWPFKKYETQSRTMLYEVSLALNGFKFVHDAIIRRSQGNVEKNPDGSDRWAVFVIDEIENAAGNENIIREKMKTYMDKVGEREVYKEEKKTDKNGNVTVQQKRDGKIKDEKNWDKDTGYLFCKTWLDWADHVCANWDSVVTISLRNSSSTLITIFQTNKWFNQSGAITTGKTRIGQLMLRIAPKTIRIVGKGGLVTSNQWGDDDSYTWDSEVAKGKWVIASDEGKLKDSDTVFKPFRVFTTDLGADKAVPLDDIGAGATECYTSKDDLNDLEKKGKLHKPLGLQSYITYVFNSLKDEIAEQIASGKRMPGTDTPEGVLNTSLTYFDNLIKGDNLANGKGLIERMYDVKPISRFSGTISQNELAVMQGREVLKRESDQSAQSELDALNNEIDVPKKYIPKGLLSINGLQNNQNINLTGYYNAFYNTVKRGMTNKTTADKSIKTLTLWVDNFMYLSEIHGAYDEIESMKQSLIDIAGNPNKSDKERSGANLVYVILNTLTDGTRTYDEVLTTEQLKQLTTESNAKETYKANRQTTRLSPEIQQSITQEVKAIAKEMQDAGMFDELSDAEIREMIKNVIQEVKAEILSGGN